MLTEFTCANCKRNLLAGEDLKYAIFLYGIFFLQGKDNGFVGTTCPSCLKTAYVHLPKSEFDDVVDLCHSFDFRGNQHFQPLRYFSPFVSHATNNPELLDKVTDCTPQVLCGDMYEDERDMIDYNDAGDSTLYQSYLESSPQAVGYFFYNLRVNLKQAQTLISVEQETGIRMIPRYVFSNDLLDTVERFCWIYQQKDIFFKDIRAFAKCDSTKLYYSEDSTIKKIAEFHEILTSAPDPWLISPKDENEMKYLWKKNNPFFGVKKNILFCDVISDFDKNGTNYKTMLDELTRNFTKQYAQEYLLEAADDFINAYLGDGLWSVKKAHWAYSNLWIVKQRFFDRYYDAVDCGLKKEAHYTFDVYDQGKTFRIIFNGKESPALKRKGFRYIHYLVCNAGKEFYASELDAIDNGTTRAFSDKELEGICVRHGTQYNDDSKDLGEEGRRINKERIKQLKNEINIAQSAGDKDNLGSLKEELALLSNETEESKEAKKIDDRVGKAINDAIDLLMGEDAAKKCREEKKIKRTGKAAKKASIKKKTKVIKKDTRKSDPIHIQAGKHFCLSIDPYADKICYRPDDINITWRT